MRFGLVSYALIIVSLAFEGKGYEYPVRGSVEMLGAEVRFRSEGWLGIPEACLPTKD